MSNKTTIIIKETVELSPQDMVTAMIGAMVVLGSIIGLFILWLWFKEGGASKI